MVGCGCVTVCGGGVKKTVKGSGQWLGGNGDTSKLKNCFLETCCTTKLNYTTINFGIAIGRETYTEIFKI